MATDQNSGRAEDELHRINVMLPKWLLERLKEEAKRETRSTSAHIMHLLKQRFRNGETDSG